MLKKIAIAGGALFLLGSVGLFFWARSVLAQDAVRVALAGQLTKTLGQPVTVGSVGATIYPRVTLSLKDVAIGAPARIQVRSLDVGTDFRALLSRRIEHADLHLNGARIELPLPPLGSTTASSPATTSTPSSGSRGPVELVSIDEVVLNGVEVVSAGRTLRGDVEVVPQGNGVQLRKLTLSADDTRLSATGAITDLAGPVGDVQIKAGTLSVDKLLAFLNDFSTGAGVQGAPASSSRPKNGAASSAMNLTVSIDADRATLGAVAIDAVKARAVLKGDDVALSPLTFNLFGGRYEGTLGMSLATGTPQFHWKANVTGIDIAAAAAFAGNPNTASGRLAGRIDLTGRGADAATAMRTARGTARIDATNGVVNNLGLVRAVVAATSLNAGAVARSATGSRDEPFTRMGATLSIANGSATTQDLLFESADLNLNAAGSMQLDGSAVNLRGQLQLSEALSKQAGGAVVRVTQQGGRVTLPATVTGAAGKYSVSIDTADIAKRALRTEANDQAKKVLSKGFGSFFKKKP
jgi:uncharacterized protein involved in outer membrane biogenesis